MDSCKRNGHHTRRKSEITSTNPYLSKREMVMKGLTECSVWRALVVLMVVVSFLICGSDGLEHKLTEADLLRNLFVPYVRSVRPVHNYTDAVKVFMGLSISQIIDVNEKENVLTTSLWVKQRWEDYRLVWSPEGYSNVKVVHVPINFLWRPDILLYNNVEGTYDVSMLTKAQLYYNGTITWSPPAVYKSSCDISVKNFPFDEQNCSLKFGSWTYDAQKIDLYPMREPMDNETYWENAEWDIVELPIRRHKIHYPCCPNLQYVDITFYFILHRKSLFYVVTFVVPCVLITILTIFVFYLPSNCGEKVTLCISILLALIVFLLLIADMIPATSKAVPLIGMYLLFTMGMVTVSITLTVIIIHIFHRTALTHTIKPWVRKLFLETLPPYLLMRSPNDKEIQLAINEMHQSDTPRNGSFLPNGAADSPGNERSCFNRTVILNRSPSKNYKRMQHGDGMHSDGMGHDREHDSEEEMMIMDTNIDLHHHQRHHHHHPPQDNHSINPRVKDGLEYLNYIVERTKNEDYERRVEAEWRFVAMVIDRIFLFLYIIGVTVGSLVILLSSPIIWESDDQHPPLPMKHRGEIHTSSVTVNPM